MTYCVEDIAGRQWRDYQAHRPGTYFSERHDPLSIEQAYALQAATARLRIDAGDIIAGYKVGCTGPGIVEQFGMQGPIHGMLYRSELHRSGVTLDADRDEGLAIEGEMALRIGPDGRPDAAFPVIELHNYVFRAPQRTLVELVANNGLNAGVVLPAGDWMQSARRLTGDGELSVHINGDRCAAAKLWPMPGGANESLEWLRGNLARFGLALSPGDLVLAGTALGLYPVTAGDHVTVGVDGATAVECFIGMNVPDATHETTTRTSNRL